MSIPYIIGHPIKKPGDFYGYRKPVARFYEIVAGKQIQSLSVLGLRRAGKTSFLHYITHYDVLSQYVADPHIYAMIYLDISSCKSPAHFCQQLLNALRRTLGQGETHNLTSSVSLDRVRALLRQFPKHRVLLLLDEFDHLKQEAFDQYFLTQLRAMTSSLDYELAYVTASYCSLYNVGAHLGLPSTSPFYNIFYPTPIYLSGLEPSDAEVLIREPAKQQGITFSKDEVSAIQRLAGSLPFLLQATAEDWFLAKRSGQLLNMKSTIPQLVVKLAPYFDYWWHHLDDGDLDLLQDVAWQGSVSMDDRDSDRQGIIHRLRSYGVLVEQGGSLNVNGEVFAAWIRQNTAPKRIRDASFGTNIETKDEKAHDEPKLHRRTSMGGIPQTLLLPLRQALMACDEFYSPRQLYAVMGADELKPFQTGLPSADNLGARVDVTIGYLSDKHRTSGENALGLLLRLLGARYDSEDGRHGQLLALADQLEWIKDRPPKPEATVLEANPERAQMLWIADAEKMLSCARAVARVEVPRFRNGKQTGRSTGTGWLVAPGLALTCWHVVEVLGMLETSVDSADLQAQFGNTLLTFDYTVAGKGLQYGVSAIEHPTAEMQTLDYAVLRLTDRDDAPFSDRGYLYLDIDAPLNAQTSLYIIQHPLGQPQQNAGGPFVRHSPAPNRILYKTPTEPGTSGAPVFNRVNWRVVALHNGENEAEHLREGTLIKSILSNLEQYNSDLYDEIMSVQSSKE